LHASLNQRIHSLNDVLIKGFCAANDKLGIVQSGCMFEQDFSIQPGAITARFEQARPVL